MSFPTYRCKQFRVGNLSCLRVHARMTFRLGGGRLRNKDAAIEWPVPILDRCLARIEGGAVDGLELRVVIQSRLELPWHLRHPYDQRFRFERGDTQEANNLRLEMPSRDISRLIR